MQYKPRVLSLQVNDKKCAKYNIHIMKRIMSDAKLRHKLKCRPHSSLSIFHAVTLIIPGS